MQAGEESLVGRLAKPATVALLAIIAAAFVALQLWAIPAAKDCLLEKAAEGAGLRQMAGCLGASTILPALLIVQATLLTSAIEALYGSFSRLAEGALASNKKTILILIATVAILTSFYIAKGDVLLGDAYVFQPAAEIFKDALGEGIPHHSFYWHGGSAHFEYYGQAYFGLVAAASLIFKDVNLTIKIVNWLLHIAAAVVFFLLAYEFTKSRKAALMAALAYSVSYEHITRIMLHGRLTNSLIYLLLPMLILVIERHASGKMKAATAAAAASLTAAAIFLTNPGDGLFALIPAAIYLGIRFWQLPGKRAGIAKTAALAGILFLLLTGFWTIPFLAEKASFNAGARVGELTSIRFMPELLKETVSFPGQRGISPLYYLGLAQLILSFIAAAQILKLKTSRTLAALTLTGAITAILLLFQSPRYAPSIVLSIALLAGAGSQIISGKISSAVKAATAGRMLIIFAAIIIIDSAGALVQPSYPDFSDEKKVIVEGMPASATGGFRSIDLHSDRRSFYPSLTYLSTKTETATGPILEGAPKSANYALAIAEKAAKEYYDENSSFSNETLDGLYMLNVKYTVLHPEQIGNKGRNTRAALGLEKQLKVAELESSPVIAALKAERYNNDELELTENYFLRTKFEERSINYRVTDEITGRMNLNRKTATAEKILLKNTPLETLPEPGGNGKLAITATVKETKHTSVLLHVQQSSDAFLQLSYAAGPEVSVFVDGKEAQYYKTAINTIAIRTTKGAHTIEIKLNPSRLRKALFLVATAAALASLAILITPLMDKIFKRRQGVPA